MAQVSTSGHHDWRVRDAGRRLLVVAWHPSGWIHVPDTKKRTRSLQDHRSVNSVFLQIEWRSAPAVPWLGAGGRL